MYVLTQSWKRKSVHHAASTPTTYICLFVLRMFVCVSLPISAPTTCRYVCIACMYVMSLPISVSQPTAKEVFLDMLVDHLLDAGGSGAVVPWYNVRKDLFLDRVRRDVGRGSDVAGSSTQGRVPRGVQGTDLCYGGGARGGTWSFRVGESFA